jgi:hypothetical protein
MNGCCVDTDAHLIQLFADGTGKRIDFSLELESLLLDILHSHPHSRNPLINGTRG